MEQERDAKEYSWKWVTADELLSKTACDLCQIILTCHGGNCNMKVFDGESDVGDYVMRLKALTNRSVNAGILCHIYCRRGLFVTLDGNCLGAFVQWRNRPSKEG